MRFRPNLLRFDSLPSTNTEVANRAVAGADEGLCVVAREQTAGRGRMERKWISPPGAGLYLSVLLRPVFPQAYWPLLSLMAAIAANEALRAACALVTDIKWPNDLLVDDKKLCGILAETVETPRGRAVVIGIGTNLKSDAVPDELKTQATSVETASGQTANPEDLLRATISSLQNWYEKLSAPDGPMTIVSEWCARSSYAEGKPVRITEAAESFTGTTRGLESDGALRVETGAGEIRIVRAGDVSSVRPAY